MSKRIFSNLLLVFVAVLAACNRQTGGQKKVLGVSLPNITNPYYVAMKKSFEDYGAANGFEVKVLIADNDDAKQLSQVQSFVEQKVDVVVLNPVSSGPGVSQILELNKAEIPVFTINILPDPDGMTQRNAIMVQGVQTDQREGGFYIGQQLVRDLGPEGSAIVGIVGEPTSISANARDDGFKEAAAVNPKIQMVALVNGKVEETTSLKVTTEMLLGNPNINVVFANTEPAALGSAAAIKQLGLQDKVALYAFVDKNGVQLIDTGEIKAGAIQEPAKLAEIAVDSAVKYLANPAETMDYIVNSPPLLVNKDNVQEVLPLAY
ncbi:MAG: substrate-binding domain-containing protein [Brevinema sp.]